jgi:hypothetical protein
MAEAVKVAFINFLEVLNDFAHQMPWLKGILQYIEKSYQNDPIRVFFEVILILVVIYYSFRRDDRHSSTKLSKNVLFAI